MAEIDPKRVDDLAKKPPRVLPSGKAGKDPSKDARAVVKAQVNMGKGKGSSSGRR
ncbi:hypothetical protein [Streptomyces sp. NPDC095613]|uniref:hypothetical protein n=1 Tax=Streptomyces sp. NPDC095613 TaxID=3155540 RepID=UPI00331C187A